MIDATAAFRDALASRGIIPPDQLIADGRIHRADVDGKNGRGDAAYLLHLDDIPAGGFQNHRDGLGWFNWRAPLRRSLTATEQATHRAKLARIRKERDAENARRRQSARERAMAIWTAAAPAPEGHPYLKRKGIKPHGVRVHEGCLVIPVRTDDEMLSLQFIDADGEKRFLKDGSTRGGYFSIGEPTDVLCIAEGFATGATIHEATGYAVAVAVNAGNLEAVAKALRAKSPAARIVLCADDDCGTESNPGLTKAKQAAQTVSGIVAVPDFGSDRPDKTTDFNDLAAHRGALAVHECIGRALASAEIAESAAPDPHRNAPRPDPACLYGLVGDIAKAGSATTEANQYAVALNFLAYLGAAVGRASYMPVGNTWHHARLFTLHVGRSARGRKGDAVSLIHRIDKAVRAKKLLLAPQVHSGGLSTREGLVLLIHDGFKEGKNEVPAIEDKRLWVVESEFANVLHQSKRDGNTLSAAQRDAFDGRTIKPATKTNRIGATDPHIGLSAAITPTELRDLLAKRELSNGFANRFLMIWSERDKVMPFPQATPQHEVDALADRVIEVLEFAGADKAVEQDQHRITLSTAAQGLYARLYRAELNSTSGGTLITALLERRAPVLLRLAMLFALCDLKYQVDDQHINAALAWVRYWSDSVRFVFASAEDEAHAARVSHAAQRIVEFLETRERATRTEISRDCFAGHAEADEIDAALDELLTTSPPRVVITTAPRLKGSPGSPTKFYNLAAKSANSANCEDSCGFASDSARANSGEVCEISPTSFRTIRTVRNPENEPETRANAHVSHNSQNSHGNMEGATDVERI